MSKNSGVLAVRTTMAYSKLLFIYVAFVYSCVVLAQDEDCSTDSIGNIYCPPTQTTSISTTVTLSRTLTLTSIPTARSSSPSGSAFLLIEPTGLTQPCSPNPTQSSAASANARNPGSRSHALAPGAKTGISIGIVAAVCSICAVVWLLWRRHSSSQHSKESEETVEKNSTNGETVPTPELDGTTYTACHISDAVSDPKSHSY
ncbi:hypothetical protein EV356DRAFT_98207 [Viridothelium virens]|uniref:Mid2 domain-containing protein n=1 Tax=Viridothelium virens TaxID=1048519 RepID=A0A6A6HEC6_VIRVR|nr:hypothetical protein EV356DRAFT_98207 [Viridothelium virens]